MTGNKTSRLVVYSDCGFVILSVALMIQKEWNNDVRDAWVLRAGAELWKAVVTESGSPSEDTQKALEAVRYALDCARRLRCAGDIPERERVFLSAEAARSAEMQAMALHQWGQGRGLNWEARWGTQWGEALSPDALSPDALSPDNAASPDSADPDPSSPADPSFPVQRLKPFL
jgi:hypothetical protein